jgi:hypothetical protein
MHAEKAVEGHRCSKTRARRAVTGDNAQRLGVRQPSGALADDGIKRKVAKTPRRRKLWPSAKTSAPLRLGIKIGHAEIEGGEVAERGDDNRWHGYWRVSETALHLGCMKTPTNTNTHAI